MHLLVRTHLSVLLSEKTPGGVTEAPLLEFDVCTPASRPVPAMPIATLPRCARLLTIRFLHIRLTGSTKKCLWLRSPLTEQVQVALALFETTELPMCTLTLLIYGLKFPSWRATTVLLVAVASTPDCRLTTLCEGTSNLSCAWLLPDVTPASAFPCPAVSLTIAFEHLLG